MTVRRGAFLAALVLAALLLVGRAVAGAWADHAWYVAMGAGAVWRDQALLAGVLRGASGFAAALFVFANLLAVRRSVVSLVLPRRVANIEIGEEVPGRYLVGAAAVIALLLGALLAIPGSHWPTLALARGGVPFGETDPYFETDLGFFVYWLPFENLLYVWALIAVLVVTAVVVFLYALTPSLRWERGTLYVSHYVRRHLVVLGTAMMLLLAWSYRLAAYRVLLEGSGPEGAFTYSDHHAAIPVSLWLSILTVGAAFVVLFFGWNGQLRAAFITLTAELVLAFGLRQAGPLVARRFADVRDAEARERPYHELRADYSRRAYALDAVLPGDSAAYPAPRAALDDVPLWDPAALRASLGRLGRNGGEVRAIGWTSAPDGLEAVAVEGPAQGVGGGVGSAGGSRTASSPERWSVLRVRAADAGADGEPVRAGGGGVGDRPEQPLPPVLVYDSVGGYALLTDSTGGIAAPSLASETSRIAYAWSLQNFHLLSSDLARRGARIFTHRGIRDRVQQLVPFFEQGSTVSPVIVADSLYWVVHLYSASAYYPLAEHVEFGEGGHSYVRHAGAALVNAHTGRVSFALDPSLDPIAESWRRRFPSLFSGAPLAPAVAAALPPAVDGARVQATVLARYGLRGEKPRQGHLPWNAGADSLLRGGAPAFAALDAGALAWMQPVLDSTDRLMGLVIGRGGRVPATHWLPLTTPGPRWNTIVDDLRRAIDSTAAVPPDAHLVHGAVRPVPLAHGLALAQSAFLWHPDAPPTLERVGVALDSAVQTGRTLAEAFGIAPPAPDTGAVHAGDFRARVTVLYGQMRSALSRGDWAAFGRAYEALGRLLARERH
ncbi:MAG TPA: UPF0182 family protein [Gemmatimonadaceae bacterium]